MSDISESVAKQASAWREAAVTRQAGFTRRWREARTPDQSNRQPAGHPDCVHQWMPSLGGGALVCRCGAKATAGQMEEADRAVREAGRQRQLTRTQQVHAAEQFVSAAQVAAGEAESTLGACVSACDVAGALAASAAVVGAQRVVEAGTERLRRVRSGDFR